MDKYEPIKLARELCFSLQSVRDEITLMSFSTDAIVEFAKRIRADDEQRIAEAVHNHNVENSRACAAEDKNMQLRQRIEELESIIQEGIEQVERFGAKNFWQKQRIAELEKDCEILRTNLDAALSDKSKLYAMLDKITDVALQVDSWASFPMLITDEAQDVLMETK